MKVQIACLSLAAAAVWAAQPAIAADFSVGGDGSVKEVYSQTGVPVPAPVPIPEYKPRWYLRLDAGVGIVSDPSVSESGYLYGADSSTGPIATLPTQSSWLDSDFDTFLTLGGGVGYYFGNGFRMDGTIERLSKGHANVDGQDEYDTYHLVAGSPATWQLIDAVDNTTGAATPDGIADQRTRVTIHDKTSISRTAWMVNGYYDFENHSRFTPYVGAGIGFTWNVVARNHTTTTDFCDNTTYSATPGCSAQVYTGATTVSAQNKSDQISLAAAAMVGVSMDVADSIKLDVGYRYMYLGGTDSSLVISGNNSVVKVGSQSLNEIHAALRFDVN